MHPTWQQTPKDAERLAELLAESRSIKGLSLGRDAWRRLRRSRIAMVSLVYLIMVGLAALLTPLWPLASPREVHTERRFAPPTASPLMAERIELVDDEGRLDDNALNAAFGELSGFDRLLVHVRIAVCGEHCLASVCGTDELGRDVLSRIFWGGRVSLLVGLVAGLVSLVIGVSYGAVSGYLGGIVDDAMMRLVDVLYAIPFIFVVIYLITVLSALESQLGGGVDRITLFFFVVGAIYWLTMARVVRGQIMSLKNEQFTEAARTIGAGRMRIIFRHLVPNLLSVVIVYLTLTIPRVMLFEAFLSFLGLGVEPPNVSWGLLANQGLRVITPIRVYWWLVVFPAVALGTTLFALNFFGDGLRDALDPRLKHR
jgi:oligopeptide transport system permease protein